MRFGYVLVYVEDVLKTVVFYERAFGLRRAFVHTGDHGVEYAELQTGDAKIGFVAERMREHLGLKTHDNRIDATPPGFELALVCEDIFKAYDEALQGGAAPVKAPVEKPWGQTIAYVRDLNGVLVELCTPIAPRGAEGGGGI